MDVDDGDVVVEVAACWDWASAALRSCFAAFFAALLSRRSCRLGMPSTLGSWVLAAAWSAFLSRLEAFDLVLASAGESWAWLEAFSAESGVSGTTISVEGLGGV